MTILVPYPDQDIVATDCLKSAVKHYFSPILAGELVIELGKAEDHFIRQGITIPEVSSLKHKGIRAIVSISERDLSDVLRKIAIRL